MSRKRGKRKKFLDNSENRFIVIVLEVAVLITIVAVTCTVLKGDIISGAEEDSQYILQNQLTSQEYSYETQYRPKQDDDSSVTHYTPGENNNPNYENNTPNYVPASGDDNVTGKIQSSLENPNGWTTAEILNRAKNAVNKTKAYSKNLTVHHKEAFDATVTECTGGSVVQGIANLMVGWVVKPVDETLNYQNGYAQNSEGETVPIILPKKGNFNLTADGLTNASARISGDEYIINLSIADESVGIGEVPTYNAGAIGYLDVANFDISFMTVDRADISYTGSHIELHINSDGYVTYASYRVPMEIDGAAHRGDISGSAVFVGEQSEIWTLNY